MSKFRRGLVDYQSAGPQVVEEQGAQPIGRIFTSSTPLPVGRVPDSHRTYQDRQGLVDSQGVDYETRRQGLVTTGGEPLRRGLAAQTIEQRQAQREAASEGEDQCERCGLDRPRESFRTLLKAEGSDQKIRVCEFCVKQTYKEGKDTWKPKRQDVRFDQNTGEAYDGIHLTPGDLVNRDTYRPPDLDGQHEPEMVTRHIAPRIGKTHW